MPTADWTRLCITLTARALRRPRIALELIRVGWRFRRRDWWRRPPFLPLPARDYIRWRLYTAFGDPGYLPTADEIIRYAHWATRPR